MTLTLDQLTADNRPYQPFGAAKELMLFKGSELLLAGPAGTGKRRLGGCGQLVGPLG